MTSTTLLLVYSPITVKAGNDSSCEDERLVRNMEFKKYDGCGNTFAIACDKEGLNLPTLAIQVCHHKEMNTDGLIIVKQNPLEMVFYNRDGSLAPMCGNGIRCFAKYVLDEGIVATEQQRFNVATGAGLLTVEVIDLEPFLCQIVMGQPLFTPESVCLKDDGPLNRKLQIGSKIVDIYSLFMGTIHVVIFVDDAVKMIGNPLAKAICEHPLFTKKTNVNFVQVKSDSELIVRTFERGVGWTLACGTGCCASYVIAKQFKSIKANEVTVLLEQGTLTISGTDEIYMTGPAVYHHTLKFLNV